MRPVTYLRIAYHIGKLSVFVVTFVPYFSWKTSRAKSHFKSELLKNGLPEELADSLAESYGEGNRNILKTVLSRKNYRDS